MSKRRRGYNSEAQVKRGPRIVHGDKELVEKLGRNDPCPCGSGRSFQPLLPYPEGFSRTSNIIADELTGGDGRAIPVAVRLLTRAA
jgi:hypothetical protein